LIAKSLLDGLTNRDSIEDLQRRLRLLPLDLESLYRHMLFVRIDELCRPKTSQLFQIVRAKMGMSESLEHDRDVEHQLPTVLLLSMVMELDQYANIRTGPIAAADITVRCQIMADRLK
jgi:hypothetical protein